MPSVDPKSADGRMTVGDEVSAGSPAVVTGGADGTQQADLPGTITKRCQVEVGVNGTQQADLPGTITGPTFHRKRPASIRLFHGSEPETRGYAIQSNTPLFPQL